MPQISPLLSKFLRWLPPAAILLSSACAYKIQVRQGDERVLEKIAQLKTGMTEEEVLSLLGAPSLPQVFRDSAWVYYYRERAVGFAPNARARGVEIVFSDGRVKSINAIGGAADSEPEAEKTP